MSIKRIKKWLPLMVLLVCVVSAYGFGLHNYFSLESLQAQKEGFLDYAHNHPVLSVLIFSALYIFSVALSLPIATLLTLLGGFLFGKWLGTLIVVTGATMGAVIVFLVAKSSLGSALREKAGGFYNKISKNMEENAVGYLFFMRLVPLFPFVLVNIVPALFNVPLRVFIFTTFFGIIPGSFVYVNVGETLGEIESLKDLISAETLIAFGLLGLFALIPTIYKQIKSKDKSK